MRTIAEPVFEDLAERLRVAGHQVDVTQTLEGTYVSPRLELRFRAKAIDTRGQHELPEGRLRLMWSTTDGKLVFEDEEASSKGTFPTHGPTHFGFFTCFRPSLIDGRVLSREDLGVGAC